MSSLTAVITCHANESGLRKMLGNLRYQTRPPDETLALCSDIPRPALVKLREDFLDVRFHRESNREDWGHGKRRNGIHLATSDFVGFFNDDDSYDIRYVEKMMGVSASADIVFCNWNNMNASLSLGSSTSGNFIVRTELARQVGYNHSVYEADGLFLEDLKKTDPRIVKVPETLYFHNVQH